MTLGFLCVAAGGAQAGLFSHKVDPRDLVGLHRIAVLARLGDTFHASWVGVTAFNNKFFDAPVPDWGIDPFVQQVATEDLKAAGTYTAEPWM
jgi:hypothetical protein